MAPLLRFVEELRPLHEDRVDQRRVDPRAAACRRVGLLELVELLEDPSSGRVVKPESEQIDAQIVVVHRCFIW